MSSQTDVLGQQQENINRILKIIGAVVIFAVAAGLMWYIQFNPFNPYLSEFDSYYHVKMAELIAAKGIPQQFPWLYFTTLRDNFVDHQLLFHMVLIPFVKMFGPILGAKIFEVLVVALAFMFLYLILKELKIKGEIWWTLLVLFTMSSDFYFRMNFIRDMGLSLFFMMAGMYFLFKNKPIVVGILCFLYVWAYGGFMFLPILAVTYVVAQVLTGEKTLPKLGEKGKNPEEKTNIVQWGLAVAAMGGMILGIVINPYFPKNLEFLYDQIFHTGLGAQEYTGGEWRPYDTWYWFQISLVPIILFLSGITLAFLKGVKQSAQSIAIFVFSLVFLVLVWKSKRFIEYAPFFLSLSGIVLMKSWLDEKRAEWDQRVLWKKAENLVYALGALVLVYASLQFAVWKVDPTGKNVVAGQIDRAKNDTQTLFSMSALTKAQDYLLQNSQEGDIVFTDDWDVFPRYFFTNSKNYYIVGLDPEFMNQYEGEPYPGQKGRLYQEFAQISSGGDKDNLVNIKTNFKAKWVMVNVDHQQFYQNLKGRPDLFQEMIFAQNDSEVDNYPQARGDGYYVFKVL